MNLSEAIIALYPDLQFGSDFVVQDDGDGPYITEWSNDEPRPQKSTLEKGWALHLKNKAISDYPYLVKKVFAENISDIDLDEQIQFSTYFNILREGITPPIKKYPLIEAQIKEWTRAGKLPKKK